jgi:hypothetical protein
MPTKYAVQTDSQVLASIESHRTATDSSSALRRLFSAIRNGLQTDHFKQSIQKWDAARRTVEIRTELLNQLKTEIVFVDSKLRNSLIRAISIAQLPADKFGDQEDMVYQALVCAAQKRSYNPQHVETSDSFRVAVPHPNLLRWIIRHADDTHPALPLIAWVTNTATCDGETNSGNQWDALLKYLLSDSPTIQLLTDSSRLVDDTIDIRSFFVRPPESPKTSYKKIRKSPYTISHGCIRTKFAEENNIENEDYLLFDFIANDFIAIVSDGASQSLMSYIAARHVSEFLYRLWIDTAGSSDYTHIKQRTIAALAAAKFATHIESSLAVDTLFKNNTYPLSTLELLRKRQKSGSQAIFACVFRRNDVLTCIWMGNSRIFIEGGTSGVVIPHNDARFSDDQSRFGSAAPMGTYGTLYIQQFDTKNGTDQDFLSFNDKWRILIHSDALDVYEEPDHLYRAPLQPPALFPVNIDAELLDKCIDHDDTTIIEIYYEAHPASQPGQTT